MQRRFAATLIMVTLVLVIPLAAHAAPRNFVAPLSGGQEVPAVDTNATGVATFKLDQDGTAMSFRLNVANIENVTQAHIHLGARGVNGPVVVWLYPAGPPAELIPGRTDGSLSTGVFTADDFVGLLDGASMADLVEEMRAGNAYVNVHTSQHPAGEIRGQLDVPPGHTSG